MGDAKTHVDTYVGATGCYTMQDRTRRANNNPHGHNCNMVPNAVIYTYRWNGGVPGTLFEDEHNNWNADEAEAAGVERLSAMFKPQGLSPGLYSVRLTADYAGGKLQSAPVIIEISKL